MGREHRIEQGDTMVSLAAKYAHAPLTIWNAGENAALRERRADMNVLAPGDVVVVPDAAPGARGAVTGLRHRFRRIGIPAALRVQLFALDGVRAEEDCELLVDGVSLPARTDANGVVTISVPPGAKVSVVSAGGIRWEGQVGHLDPIDSLRGVQQRLVNLGFGCSVTGELDAPTTFAIAEFQHAQALEETGTVTPELTDRLAALHDRTQAAKP